MSFSGIKNKTNKKTVSLKPRILMSLITLNLFPAGIFKYVRKMKTLSFVLNCINLACTWLVDARLGSQQHES